MSDAFDYQRAALRDGITQELRNPINDTFHVLKAMIHHNVPLEHTTYGPSYAILRPSLGPVVRPDVVSEDALRLQFLSVDEYHRMALSNNVQLLPDRPYISAVGGPGVTYQHGRRVRVIKFEKSSTRVGVPSHGVALFAFNMGANKWGCRAYPYEVPTGQRVLKLAVTERSLWQEHLSRGRPINIVELLLGGSSSAGLSVDEAYAAVIAEPTVNTVTDASESLDGVVTCDADEDPEDDEDGEEAAPLPAECPRDPRRPSCPKRPIKMNTVVARQLAEVVKQSLEKSTGASVVGAVASLNNSLPTQTFGDDEKVNAAESWPALAHIARSVAIVSYHRENYEKIEERAAQIARRRVGAAASSEIVGRRPVVGIGKRAARAPVGGGHFHLEAMLELARESVGLAAQSPLGDALFETYQRAYAPASGGSAERVLKTIDAMPTFNQLIDQISGLPPCFERTPVDQLNELLDAEIDQMRQSSVSRDKLERYSADLLRGTTPLARGGALFGPSGVADFILSMCVPQLFERTNQVLYSVLGLSRRAVLRGYPVGAALADSHSTADIRGMQMTVMASASDAAAALQMMNGALCIKDNSPDLRRVLVTSYVFNWREAESLVERYETNPDRVSMIPLRDGDGLRVYLTASPSMQGLIGARTTLFPANDDEKNEANKSIHQSLDPRSLVPLKYLVSGVSNGGNTLLALDSFSGVVVAARTVQRIPVMESSDARNSLIVAMFAAIYSSLQVHDSSRASPLALWELIKGTGEAAAVSRAFSVQQPDKSQAELMNVQSSQRQADLLRVVKLIDGNSLVLLAGANSDVRSTLKIKLDTEDKSNSTLDVEMGMPDGGVGKLKAKFDPRFGRGGEYRMQRRVDDEEPSAGLMMQQVPEIKLSNGSVLRDVVLVSYWCQLYATDDVARQLVEEQARRLQRKSSGEAAAQAGTDEDADEYHVLPLQAAETDATLFGPGSAWDTIEKENPELAGPCISGVTNAGEKRGHGVLHSWASWHTRPTRWPYYGYTQWY